MAAHRAVGPAADTPAGTAAVWWSAPLQPATPDRLGLHVRRAALADVPALARLLEVPHDPDSAAPLPLPRHVLASALRLTLAHVGLDRGEVWVAVDADDRVASGLAVLPPRHARTEAALVLALRLELRLDLPAGPLPPPGALALPEDGQWLLLPVAPHLTHVEVLLPAALQGLDRRGAGVVTVAPAGVHPVLPAAGFAPVPGAAGVLVRGARGADDERPAPAAGAGRRALERVPRAALGG